MFATLGHTVKKQIPFKGPAHPVRLVFVLIGFDGIGGAIITNVTPTHGNWVFAPHGTGGVSAGIGGHGID
jgi:hypothetical protein